MRSSVEAAAISALKDLQVPYLHHERTGLLTIPVQLESRGMTLVGVHCFEPELEVWLEATIFTPQTEHQAVVACRLLELNAELKWVHYGMIDGRIFLETYIDLSLVSDYTACILQHLIRLVASIDDTYGELLNCMRSPQRPQTRVEREIEALLNGHDGQRDA